MKKVIMLAALVAVAFAAGIGTVVAVTDTYFVANGTGSASWTNAFLDRNELVFTNDATGFDQIHMGNGTDRINLGSGNDLVGFATGTDLLDLSGGFGIITWGLYGPLGSAYPWPDTTLATNYISCDTSDDALNPFPTSMEIRSDELTMKANTGDVVIQLGN